MRGKKPPGRGDRALKVRVKSAKGRRTSSTRWLQRQLNDPYVARAQREAWATRFLGSFEEPAGLAARTFADKLRGLSYSDMDELAGDVRRRRVLALPDADLPRILRESA